MQLLFLDIIHRHVFYLKQHFGDWILSTSSGKNVLSWAKSIELVLSPETGTSSIDWAQRCVLNKKTGLLIMS
jgi:hypothetical protein